ncbi:cation diffusion facilitator family transporter [Lederbergia lenta]|uniref:Cation diffusion facilitator family transporter n=1 Tax=Lederbergia lenta TaxID=1467 RepID=A0A2X4WHL4_LEDLE|nr:cation diffusion facilitator family transporter [Lederbergia lenta]MCM3109374.1 cation diffusion facilitator family transporter [Lederbergia lenta]MEC2324861.1 cation diffusion facilitator family transporter [Lederbergia lenta]SQI57050.1 cation diffusion facilitator family transporter [Lederbergia lenta]
MDQQKYANLKLAERGAIIGIIAYLFLAFLKLFIGVISHSEALKADGFNNTTDIVASIALLIGLKLSQRPADEDHLYGHWKSETIASMIASFIMMTVGLQVVYGAIKSLFDATKESPDMLAGWVGVFSALLMYLVYMYNRKLAKKVNSQAVMAAAKDNISDAWVSIGTAIGIFGTQLGLPWLDPLTAVIVGLLICKTAWEIFRDTSHLLTDGFDEEEIETYKKTIQNVRGVMGVKEMKARNYGNNAVVDIVILVDSTLDINTAHDISTKVEKILINEHDVYDVHVHVEPDI